MTDSRRFQEVEALFHQARAQRPEERAAFLDEVCRGNVELRAEVESLLAHSIEERQDAPPSADDSSRIVECGPIQEGPGSRIGAYKLLQLIGEGGFGAVYMAEQKVPVRRRVALKIIKLGMDTKQVIARFEAERQALALMTHPNISKVFDGGATDTGRPYFVMELVKGVSITEYCDGANLSTEQRLKLFVMVCNAVQHAHQKGIIHRDIKPSNVMVTLHDGEPVPKVIDFGIAKATNQELTEKTLFTEFRQFIGTPEYMSPEQAEMSGLDIDTRSDVYSLGVLLYELLTGTTPLDPQRLRSAAYGEIRRIIREEEPDKPSTRLSTLGESLIAIARNRHAEAGVLRKSLRGDLDWIVMKALEKDRTRRYETASGLARDVERHLRHEPVVAGPPSTSYRFGKFLRRHRTGVTAASMMLAALLVGLGLATVGFVQARRERDRAIEAEELATRETAKAREAERVQGELRLAAEEAHQREAQQRTLAEENAVRVQKEADATESINDFFVDMLAMADPMMHAALPLAGKSIDSAGTSLGQEESVAEMLRRASGRIGPAFADKPELEARVRATIGMTLEGMDHSSDALPHLERALEIRRQLLGEDHPDTLISRLQVASAKWTYEARGVRLARSVLEDYERLFGPEDRRTMAAARVLGGLLRKINEYPEAEVVFRETLERQRRVLGSEDPDTLETMLWFALLYGYWGKRAKVRPLVEEAYEITQRKLNEDHPSSIQARLLLGWFSEGVAAAERTEQLFRDLVEDCRRIYGESHWTTLLATLGLARSLDTLSDGTEIEQLLWPILPAISGVWKVIGIEILVCVHLDHRNFDEALSITRIETGPGASIEHVYQLGCVLQLAGQRDEAQECFSRVWQHRFDASLSPGAGAEECNGLAWNMMLLDSLSEADYQEALELAETAVRGLPDDGAVWNTLGVAQYRAGLHQEALETLNHAGELASDPLNQVFIAMAHHRLGDSARAAEQLDQARGRIRRNEGAGKIETRMFLAEAEALLSVESPDGK